MRAAHPQHAHQRHVVLRRAAQPKARFQQATDKLGAFEVDAEQQKSPALAMAHRRVGGALEQVQVGDDLVQERRRAVAESAGRIARHDP